MKPNRFERNYRDTPAPAEGVQREFSNKTPMGRSAGKIAMSCDHCGLSYETYACWAKRTARHFCSRACANAAKEVRVEKSCVICGTVFTATPSTVDKSSTCSRKCLRENRRRFLLSEASNMSESSIFNYGNHEHGAGLVFAKLDEDKVRAIRDDQRTQSAIAADYGISQSAVSQIKLRTIWAHVK